MVSSWRRVGPNTIPHAAKATGVYLNSMLATHEARRAGYDEAILLTEDGYVADGPGETIFMVKNGTLYTPDLARSILPGITRDTIIQIAQDLGHKVVEKPLIRTDLYTGGRGLHDRHRDPSHTPALDRRARDRRRAR